MLTKSNCFLLDENAGEFVAEDGRKVEYHKARFYDLDSCKVFKVNVPKDGNALPEPQVHVCAVFEVNAGESYCRLAYQSYELLKR